MANIPNHKCPFGSIPVLVLCLNDQDLLVAVDTKVSGKLLLAGQARKGTVKSRSVTQRAIPVLVCIATHPSYGVR